MSFENTTAAKNECFYIFSSPFLVQNAVGITIENWTNQKLEFPEDFISEGARDMWYKPSEVTWIIFLHLITFSNLP